MEDDETSAFIAKMKESGKTASLPGPSPRRHLWIAASLSILGVLVVALFAANVFLWKEVSAARSLASKSMSTARAAETASANANANDFDPAPSTDDLLARQQISDMRTCINNFFQAFSSAQGGSFSVQSC